MNNENNAARSTIIDVFGTENDQIFAGVGLKLTSSKMDASLCVQQILGDSILSILSASGEEVRILSSINVNFSTLASLYPHGEADTDALRDWCGELNNQLVGAAKNQMLAYECKMMMGIPTLIQGENLASIHSSDAFVSKRHYSCAQGEVITYLSILLSPRFKMRDEPDMSLTGIEAGGELSFF